MAHEKDMTSKKLEDYTDVFADILNVLLFHKNLLKPELLKSGRQNLFIKRMCRH